MEELIGDASTVILLAKVTILRSFAQDSQVTITPQVKVEVLRKNKLDDAKIISALLQEKIIAESKNADYQKFMDEFGIGPGEAEGLAVAYQQKKILATDDWRAIKACKILGVRFVTAIHCLIYLVKKGKIDQKMARAKLKNLENYGRYNTEIIKDAKTSFEGENHG